MMFVLLLVVCVCFLIFRVFSKPASEPPAVKGWLPIIGHLHRLIFSSNMHDFLKDLSIDTTNEGGVCMLDFGYRKLYFLTDPEDCLTIANACLDKEKVYDTARPLVGNSLIMCDVPTWKIRRKLLNPAFGPSVVNQFVASFNKQARLLVKLLAQDLGQPIDQDKLLRINILETVCMTSTGLDRKEDGDLRKRYGAFLTEVLKIFTIRYQKIWLLVDFIFNMSPMKKKQDDAINCITKLSNQLLETKKANMRNGDKTKCSDGNKGRMKPFMNLILELANETGNFTDQDIIYETTGVIVAGHETSASNLTFAFALLGSHPEVQDKVYAEIQNVLGNTDRDLEKDDLSKLVYTEAVLKETLRLYPVISLIGRFADKPVKLKHYTVKADTGIFLSIMGLNRHPVWGPDADQFKPERWLDTATLPDLNYFGGFGLGRRNCIGKVYAMTSMKIIMSHVVRRYQISSDVTKMKLKWDVLTKPLGTGHCITLQIRNN